MSENNILIHVIIFAHLRELIGQQKIDLEIPQGTDVLSLKRIISTHYPRIQPALDTIIIAVNQEFAPDTTVIPEGAEVAIFPPVSGGSDKETICKIISEPIRVESYSDLITHPATGGVCTFIGKVRAVTESENSRQTIYLEYDAYLPMAEKKMVQISEEMRERWSQIEGIVIVQRIGKLAPGENSVLVMCAAAHRDTGIFEATRYGIDRLKEIVPVWKREVSPDGEEWIEGSYLPGKGD